MTADPTTSLFLWKEKRDQYLRELADSNLLSPKAKKDLHDKLLESRRKIRYWKLAVELEQTEREIAEMKAEA